MGGDPSLLPARCQRSHVAGRGNWARQRTIPGCSCSDRSSSATSTRRQQDIIDDIDFFAFPAINEEHGQDAVEAPIDGFMMAASPANEEGAKAVLAGMGGGCGDRGLHRREPIRACRQLGRRHQWLLRRCSRRRPRSSARRSFIAQFLDRDTDPDFAANVVGAALADFISDPSQIDSILSTVEEQKQTYTFE